MCKMTPIVGSDSFLRAQGQGTAIIKHTRGSNFVPKNQRRWSSFCLRDNLMMSNSCVPFCLTALFITSLESHVYLALLICFSFAGLVSPVSGCGSEGPTLQSPQDNYLDMASPSERKHLGLTGLSTDQSYMCMDRQAQGNSGSESSGYMPMAPLNSPGNVHPAWPSFSSSQVGRTSELTTVTRVAV